MCQPIFRNRLVGSIEGLTEHLSAKNTAPGSHVVLPFKALVINFFKVQ